MLDRPTIAVSACLLGEAVRYDGGHRRDRFIADVLPRAAEVISICPEAEIGMGTPRPPIELVSTEQGIRLQPVAQPASGESPRDYTAAMKQFALDRLARLKATPVDGFVLKRGSPSCGFEQVKVRQSDGSVERTGRGVFADAVRTAHRWVPFSGEDRLQTEHQQQDFLIRIGLHFRLRLLFSEPVSRHAMIEFHQREKPFIQRLNRATFKRLQSLIENADHDSPAKIADEYRSLVGDVLVEAANATTNDESGATQL